MARMNKPATHDPNWYQQVTDNWTAIENNVVEKGLLTTKGDLVAASGPSSPARVGVGADGTMLSGDSTQTTGLGWIAPSTFAPTATVDMLWGKKFFEDEGFLPSTKIFEYLGTPPAFAGTAGSATWNREPGAARPDNTGIAWYDIGASKSKILIVVGNMARLGSSSFMAVHLTPSAPSGVDPDGYSMRVENLYQRSGGAYTLIGSSGLYTVDCVFGQALYFDNATHKLRLFVRTGGQWFQATDAVDLTFQSLRYVALQSGLAHQRFATPFVCYAE